MSIYDVLSPFLPDADEASLTVLKALTDVLDATGTDKLNLANLASGEYVKKAKYDGDVGRLQADKDTLTGQVTDLQGNLDELSKSTGDIDAIKTQAATDLTASQTKFDEAQATSAKNILGYEVKLGVIEAGARDAISVMAHLDMEKLSIADGKLSGLDTQLTPLQESHKHLFGEPVKVFSTTPPNPPPPADDAKSEWAQKYKAAQKINATEAIKVKQAAFEAGVIIS